MRGSAPEGEYCRDRGSHSTWLVRLNTSQCSPDPAIFLRGDRERVEGLRECARGRSREEPQPMWVQARMMGPAVPIPIVSTAGGPGEGWPHGGATGGLFFFAEVSMKSR